MKMRPLRAELLHAGGRRAGDMTKLLAILQTRLDSTLLIHYDWLSLSLQRAFRRYI